MHVANAGVTLDAAEAFGRGVGIGLAVSVGGDICVWERAVKCVR
jgi:hypothetical protein